MPSSPSLSLQRTPEDLEPLRRVVDLRARAPEHLAEAHAPEHEAHKRGLALSGHLEIRDALREREQIRLGDTHLATERLALDVYRVQLHQTLDGEPALLQSWRDLRKEHGLHELIERATTLFIELRAELLSHLQHRRSEAGVVLMVDVLHQVHLLARLDPGLGKDGGKGGAHRQELAERELRVVDHEQLVEQPQRRALALHQRRHVHEHLDERRVKRIDVAQVVDVGARKQRRQHLLVALRQAS